MKSVLAMFEKICSYPHCSGKTEKLREFLVENLQECGCDVLCDKAGNIYALKGEPRVCLQAHYDMVCLEESQTIELCDEGEWLRARETTLGADNGIGVAMMVILARTYDDIELLFTNDEEIGLLGAIDVTFPLLSSRLLNLDSEELGAVYVGCAGGIDLFASKRFLRTPCEGYAYEFCTTGLLGGHSGVDIDKAIPNGLSLLASYIARYEGRILSFEGGERINSIPVHAKVVALFPTPLCIDDPHCLVKEKGWSTQKCYPQELTSFLASLFTGVVAFHEKMQLPDISQNWARIESHEERVHISYSLRAMSQEGLNSQKTEMCKLFEKEGFCVETEGKYPPWEIETTPFVDEVCQAYEKVMSPIVKKAIHAGLECAILKKRYPHISMASIGPTILAPHSTGERVHKNSIGVCFEVVKEILKG